MAVLNAQKGSLIMTLKIYGVSASRAIRTLWMAEELGLQYEHIATPFKGGGTRKPEFLAVNPNGHIPAIDDDGLKLWESMAINLYLARKHGGPLAAASLTEEAEILKWTFWVVTECEKDAVTIILHRAALPEAQRDESYAIKAAEKLQRPLKILDQHLATREWIAADRFTVADLNCAAILTWIRPDKVLYDSVPNLQRWLKNCLAREAFQRAKGLA
jgi:glutathione S-transferase